MIISLLINHQCSMIQCHSWCFSVWRELSPSAGGSSGWCDINPAAPGEQLQARAGVERDHLPPTLALTKAGAEPAALHSEPTHLTWPFPLLQQSTFNISMAILVVSAPSQRLPLLIQVVNLFHFLQELPHHQDQI